MRSGLSLLSPVPYHGGIPRSYYGGRQGWLGHGGRRERHAYRRGDLWASVGAWFSSRWWNAPARSYIRDVKRRLESRSWRSRVFRRR